MTILLIQFDDSRKEVCEQSCWVCHCAKDTIDRDTLEGSPDWEISPSE